MAIDVLELRNLSAGYANVEVVHEIDLAVAKGELVYLMGRNGVGKTTTLKCIMGLIPPRSGSVRYGGAEIGGKQPYEIARLGIGFVPDNRRIFPFLTVRQTLEVFADNPAGSPGWTLDRIYDLFPILKKRASVKAGTLSGGEQEMLAVGRALMRNPKTLLLDEPFEGLAPLVVEHLAEVFLRIKSGISILLVEQNERHSARIADRCCLMERGRIVSESTPDTADRESPDRVNLNTGRRNFWDF